MQPLVTRKRKKHENILKSIITRIIFRATKREKLIFTTLVVTSFVLVTAFTPFPLWILAFLATIGVCLGLVLFALWGDFGGIRYFFIPLMPCLFTAAVVLNMLVVPMIPVVEFIIVMLFGVTLYLILLISNIFNVSAIRTIPLMRAAHAASFFLNLVTTFLLLFYLSTLKLHPFLLLIGNGVMIFVPSLYLFWSFELKQALPRKVMLSAAVLSFIGGQVAFVLSFWPISPLLYALFLVTIYYVCCGVIHQDLMNRLNRRIIVEYILVLMFTFFLLVVMAQWG